MERIIRAKIENERKGQVNQGATASLKVIQLEGELGRAKEYIAKLEELAKNKIVRESLDINLVDPIPADKEKRRLYVGAVAGLHNDILRPKLLLMIAKVREALAREENTREQDLQLKGTEYALWEIIRWGDLMLSEDKAYTAGQNPSVPEDRQKQE